MNEAARSAAFKEEKIMSYLKIFSAKMANKLRKEGFWIVGTEPNMKKPWLDVFLFEDCEAIRQRLYELSEHKQEE